MNEYVGLINLSSTLADILYRGAGSNLIYLDRENDLLVVARWIQRAAIPAFIAKVLAAMP